MRRTPAHDGRLSHAPETSIAPRLCVASEMLLSVARDLALSGNRTAMADLILMSDRLHQIAKRGAVTPPPLSARAMTPAKPAHRPMERSTEGSRPMEDWQRSFPAAQLEGHFWIVPVIEDLVGYCAHNDLTAMESELRVTLLRMRRLLAQHADPTAPDPQDLSNFLH